MRNFTISLALFLCLFVSKIVAQENTFEARAKAISIKIETITKIQKDSLKIEIEAINNQLDRKEIEISEANAKKQQAAEKRAANVENRVGALQQELNNLVQDKVDGKLQSEYQPSTFSFISYKKKSGANKEKYRQRQDSIYNTSEKRTTSQFVFAFGVNNLITYEKAADSDYRYLGSHFYEWGLTANTRILEKSNLLHVKYGLSLMYNNLRPTDDRIFVKNGEQTNLETSAIALKDSRFRNVYLVAPLYLEFDFSKNKTKDNIPFFKSHQSFRVGLGGYAGTRIKSKQILKFEDDNQKSTLRSRGDFNASNFIYGVGAYVGYKQTSLYVKYDLNPLFKNNAIDQNNISLGIRHDFN
jgi:hypothetical protein